MQPGEMDQVVTLYKPETTTDKFGQHTTWDVIASAAARVRPLQGREFFAAASLQAPPSVEMEIYFRADVQSNWRVAWMSRWYELTAAPIDVESRHATLQLMCRGVAGAPPVPAAATSTFDDGAFDALGFSL